MPLFRFLKYIFMFTICRQKVLHAVKSSLQMKVSGTRGKIQRLPCTTCLHASTNDSNSVDIVYLIKWRRCRNINIKPISKASNKTLWYLSYIIVQYRHVTGKHCFSHIIDLTTCQLQKKTNTTVVRIWLWSAVDVN